MGYVVATGCARGRAKREQPGLFGGVRDVSEATKLSAEGSSTNVAVMFMSAFTVTLTGLSLPLRSPLQLLKTQPDAGTAVSSTGAGFIGGLIRIFRDGPVSDRGDRQRIGGRAEALPLSDTACALFSTPS